MEVSNEEQYTMRAREIRGKRKVGKVLPEVDGVCED
jgi:hypothetical protein